MHICIVANLELFCPTEILHTAKTGKEDGRAQVDPLACFFSCFEISGKCTGGKCKTPSDWRQMIRQFAHFNITYDYFCGVDLVEKASISISVQPADRIL